MACVILRLLFTIAVAAILLLVAHSSRADTQPTSVPASWRSTNAGISVRTSGGLNREWTERKYDPAYLWAYHPVKPQAVPVIRHLGISPQNPIDAFIFEKLVQNGLRPASSADPLTLLRRAAFDLTGLPPTPHETESFLRDRSADAFERAIDRLLSSPHYGEQQARHWFDVVRYADTSGFSNDYERPNAWRYRDYVIRSFNRDKPFDRFIVEQLAGDELSPPDSEALIAVGFLRMGPWEHTAMTVAAVTRQQYLDDVTHSVGVTFLGQGLRCARCHDHKFDPVPTRDYYRIQAVFASTQFAERELPFLACETLKTNSETQAAIRRRLDETKGKLEVLRRKNRGAIAAYLKEKGVATFEDLPREGRLNRGQFGLSKDELTLRKLLEKRRDYFERELYRYEPYVFSVYSGPPNNYSSSKPLNGMPDKLAGEIPEVHILLGGSIESPGEAVAPDVLSVTGEFANSQSCSAIPSSAAGRRLAFAHWVADAKNPLTSRVIVNRIWQQHFGKGLVATPNNLGKMGGRPTHPELLDWLASWFVENGWSIKRLHKLIMTSATYQQSNKPADWERVRAFDPKNELLACFPTRRLAAEELRDAMLAISGELNADTGGPGTFPEINWEVAFQPRHIMGSVAPAYQPSPTRPERNRRTIYNFRYRTLVDPLLEVFNRPGSEISCERRDETTITPQAFSLLNSEFVNKRALALASQLQKKSDSIPGQITRVFQAVHGRRPTENEMADCQAHLTRMTAWHRDYPPKPVPLPTSVERNMVEEMTGETIHWTEELDALKNYQPDLMPWEVGPETRALADLCLVLFNSNEFLYLR